jgi:hypothetical protein
MIKGLLGVFCLAMYVIVFLHLSRISFGIYIHLTHNSQFNVVIFIETYNSKRTESSYMY